MTTADTRASLWHTTAGDLRAIAEHYRQRATEPVHWWQLSKRSMQRHFHDWDLELAAKLAAIADEMTTLEAQHGSGIWTDEHLRAVAQQAAQTVRHIKMAMEATR